jgi:circadian clock protein KaiB
MKRHLAPPRAGKAPRKIAYVLKLYVAGTAPRSLNAIANIKRLCEENLPGRYALDVIDMYQQPQLARGEQIVVLPTLVRNSPSPQRRVIGDLSNAERVLAMLDIGSET